MIATMFIALEGTDGSGLSTQTERLSAWFRAKGAPVHATKEPSGGPAGALARLALAHRLEAGVSVVCDRYLLSTYAYQGLGLDLAWLRAVNARARVPDLTVVVDVPVEVSVERMRARGVVERYEQRETLLRVRDNIQRLIPQLRAEGQRIALVDGTMPPDAVSAAIAREVDGRWSMVDG